MNSVSQFNGEHRFGAGFNQASWVGGGLNKGTMTLARAPVPRESFWTLVPSALTLKSFNLIPPLFVTCSL